MQTLTIINEDSQIQATRVGGHWNVQLGDGKSGMTHDISATDTELAAILALSIAGDGMLPPEVNNMLYQEAEIVLIGCPNECRPIP